MVKSLRKSYVATRLGPLGRLNEMRNLYLMHTRQVGSNVRGLVNEASYFRATIAEVRGTPVRGLKVLEVGPGQQFVELTCFGVDNDVVGIDTDVLAPRQDVSTTLRMLRSNGVLRTSKTLLRKIAGIDRSARKELLLQLRMATLPPLNLLQMDANSMDFPDDSFDVVYSRAVFEHLVDPAGVIKEVRRVLRPGGVMFVRLHLYTSDSGIHDTRIFAGLRGDLPLWSHLRPEHAHKVRPNSFLNRVRLAEWNRLFDSEMPGSTVNALCDAADSERYQLAELRAAGELQGYTDSELLSPTVDVVWRKPNGI